MSVIIYEFVTDGWELLNIPDENITAWNPSGFAVELIETVSNTAPVDVDPNSIVTIGGFYSEYVCTPDKYLWARSTVGNFVRIRPSNTVDPEADIGQLGKSINDLRTDFQQHKIAIGNPHHTNKIDIGLGELPNETTSTPNCTNNALVQLSALNVVATKLKAHEDILSGNPHKVKKADVGLGKVPNYPAATELTASDPTINNEVMTPLTTAIAIGTLSEMAYSIAPQCIVQGNIGTRPVGWNFTDCSSPTELMQKSAARTIKILSGLQVSYASVNKSRLSNVLNSDIVLVLPPEQYPLFYIYVDILKNNIVSAGATNILPQTGEKKEGYLSDFFSYVDCTMYDIDGNKIQRVYIGKVFMSGTDINTVVSVPIGSNYTMAIPSLIAQNQRYLYVNPYIEPVNIATQVEHDSVWGYAGWNDQVGVEANLYPLDPLNKIVLQTGLFGLIASGQESGSSFGLTFPTVTSPIRARLHLSKRYR